eukprot:scaffold265780_cov55-Prasinocladus_malaysianus.AAC.1
MATCAPITATINWAAGQPDNPSTELCMSQGASTAGGNKQHDHDCSDLLPFACVINAEDPEELCAARNLCPPPP